LSNTNLTKNRGWTQVHRKGKQFLLHYWHPLCESSYKPGDVMNEERDRKCLGDLSWFWLSWPFGFIAPRFWLSWPFDFIAPRFCYQNILKLFGFLIFRYWSYLMKVIPETCRCALNLISMILLLNKIKEYVQFLNRLYDITWFGVVYA
jgi:hypothetical protein